MRPLFGALLFVAFIQSGACVQERCDAKALPIAGSYAQEAPAGAFVRLQISVGQDEVDMEYMRPDGTVWTATYLITGRGTTSGR